MSNGDEFFGLNKDEQVQNLEEDVVPAKKGRFKMAKGSGGAASGGKILGICIIISLIFSMAASWFMVSMLGPSKGDVNNTIAAINTLAGDFSDFEESTSQSLTSKATESWVDNKGYSTQTWVNAKVSDLASQTWVTTQINNAVNGSSNGSTQTIPNFTLMSGGCNISVNGSCMLGAQNMSSCSIWTRGVTSSCAFVLTASSDLAHTYYGSFDHWEINGLRYTTNPITVNVSSAQYVNVVAYSTGSGNLVTYTLTSNVSPSSSGTVTMSGSNPYVGLSVINISAIPASGFIFSNWTSTPSGATFGNATQASTTVTANGNYVLNANFRSCLATVPTLVNPTPDGTNVSVGSGTINISWSQSNAISYDVTVFGGTPPVRSFTPTTNYIVIPVAVNTSYSWRVGATGECGGTVFGSWWSFNVVP
jgi:hypothetical protein